MHTDGGRLQVLTSSHPPMTRRGVFGVAAGIASGAALVALPGSRWTQIAAAQDHDGVILIAGAAEIGASPGEAFARSAVAEAAATRGAARVQAAASLAEADSEGGAITQSPVAFAAADPDEGAVAQGAVAVASASSQDDGDDGSGFDAPAKVIAPAGRGGSGRRAQGGGGGRSRGGGRMMGVGRGGGGRQDRRGRGSVDRLPSSGIGSLENRPLTSLFAAAAAAAGGVAVLVRRQLEPEVAHVPVDSGGKL